MATSVNISKRQEIRSLLSALKPGATPIWGDMKPQQMIEHLIDQVAYTNGHKPPTLDVTVEEAKKSKQKWIYTDAIIPRNIILGTLPEQYLYSDLKVAIEQLLKELSDFDDYYHTPGITAIHGGFGPLTHSEWIIWHNKHFTHHFKQFGLIEG